MNFPLLKMIKDKLHLRFLSQIKYLHNVKLHIINEQKDHI
jgi:hypothetical protein